MRLAYLDCASGIAGDMMLAALIDAGADLPAIQAGIASLGLPNVQILTGETKRKGFRATQVDIRFEPEHKHRHLHHITDMIDAGALTPRAKELAKKIFTRLGEAEAKVHGVEIRSAWNDQGRRRRICPAQCSGELRAPGPDPDTDDQASARDIRASRCDRLASRTAVVADAGGGAAAGRQFNVLRADGLSAAASDDA